MPSRPMLTRPMLTRPILTRTALTLALLVGAGAAADAAGERKPRPTVVARDRHPTPLTTVDGHGGGILSMRGFEGDRVTFRLHATTEPDDATGVDGTFEVTHVAADGTLLADFGGRVDCLMKGADTAVLTGVVTRGSAPGLPPEQQPLGHEIGLTVANDGARGHIGWSWLVMGFHDVEYCTGVAPVFPVTTGRFRVSGPDWTPPQAD